MPSTSRNVRLAFFKLSANFPSAWATKVKYVSRTSSFSVLIIDPDAVAEPGKLHKIEERLAPKGKYFLYYLSLNMILTLIFLENLASDKREWTLSIISKKIQRKDAHELLINSSKKNIVKEFDLDKTPAKRRGAPKVEGW